MFVLNRKHAQALPGSHIPTFPQQNEAPVVQPWCHSNFCGALALALEGLVWKSPWQSLSHQAYSAGVTIYCQAHFKDSTKQPQKL